MVDIVGINTTSQQANRVSDRGSVSKSVAKEKPASTSSSSSDRIEISAGAREAQTVGRLVTLAQDIPDIRPDVVAEAKRKLENGEYEGVDVSRQAAKNILGIK